MKKTLMHCNSAGVFLAVAVIGALPCAGHAAGAGYPAKPIRLIVPFAPGGGASLVGRVVAQELTEAWGQSVVVDNRAGAGGAIGTELAVQAAPDGYTLVMATASTVIIHPLMEKTPFDPVKDLTPIAHTTTVPLVLVVHPSVAAKSVQEFIALARAPGAQLNFASSGEGTINHLAGELFKSSTGAKMTHVPYRGGGQAIVDLVAGHVQAGFVNILETLPQIKAGRLRALGVTSASRSPVLPDVPTIAEGGVPGYEVVQWSGVLGPAGLPRPIVAKLNGEIERILARPQVREHFANDGAQPGGGSAERFGAFIRSEIAKWRKVIQTAGIKTAK